jgi:hypothetical protein
MLAVCAKRPEVERQGRLLTTLLVGIAEFERELIGAHR